MCKICHQLDLNVYYFLLELTGVIQVIREANSLFKTIVKITQGLRTKTSLGLLAHIRCDLFGCSPQEVEINWLMQYSWNKKIDCTCMTYPPHKPELAGGDRA